MKKIFICLLILGPRLLLAQTGVEDERLVAAQREVTRAQAAADRPAVIRAFEELGQVQLEAGETSDALASFRLSLKLARESDEQPAIARNLLEIGRIHLQEGRVPAAAETLRRAVVAAEGIDAQEVLFEAHASLSDAAAATGQYRQAYESSRLASELSRARIEKAAQQRRAELEAQLEADRQRMEAEASAGQQELLRERREKAELEKRIRQLGGLAIATGVALALLALSLVSRHRLKRRTSQVLAESESQFAQVEGELQHSSEELARISQLRDHALSEYDRLSAELLKSAGERDRLAAELEQSSSKLQRTSEQLEHHFIELKRTAADRDRAVGELAKFAGERDQHLAAFEQTTGKLEQLSAELERTAGERDRHASLLERTTSEAERISDALMQASADRDLAAGERDRAIGQRDKAVSERDRLTDQLARVSDELEQLRHDCRQDISAMADRNAAVRSRLAEMESFNSTLSQHLKVLLVAVRSSLGALQQDAAAGDVEQLEKDVRRTHIAVGNTVRLLDELQKLLMVGRVVHAPEAASMSELAYEAIGQVQGLADRRVEVVIAPAMPAVYGDRAQLLEVLLHLLENGGKFMGSQPSPRLQVGHRRDWPRADSPEEVFYVRDNGIGIEAHDQERVFTLFEKLDPASDGLGIGLPLVRRIIEAHGGRVWVESDGAGRGSTFCFTLAKKYASPPPS